MKESPLQEIIKITAKYYGLHPDCMSNADNTMTQQKARQAFVLLALKFDYTVGDTARAIRRSVKQVYNIASTARKNRMTDEDMQMAYSVCFNTLLLKGVKIKEEKSRINYDKYEPFVNFTRREQAEMEQAQISAEKFMEKYGA